MMRIIGITLITLGALNAVLAVTAETCTQGGADSLSAGILTLVLYVFGTVALIASEPPRYALLALAPSAMIAVWHSIFAVRFFAGYWFFDISACSAMAGAFSVGNSGEWMDGDEPYYSILWLALSAAYWLGAFRAFRSSRDQAD
jgi:hypothetical protein